MDHGHARPRPEDFLELVQRARRGRLKLYIGFAAGVGKTWRMLEEAQALRKRGVAFERVRAIVEDNVEGRDLGILGEPRVNVLLLNLALDRRFGAPPAPAEAAAPQARER